MVKLVALVCALTLGCDGGKRRPSQDPGPPAPAPVAPAQPPPAAAPAPAPRPAVQIHDGQNNHATIKLNIPADLADADDGAAIRDPNTGEFLTGISFSLTCNGDCAHGLADHLSEYVDNAPIGASRPTTTTVVHPDVEIVDRGALPDDGKYVVYRVKKPPGATGPYREELDATCARMMPDKQRFVAAHAFTLLATEQKYGAAIVEACKSFEIQP